MRGMVELNENALDGLVEKLVSRAKFQTAIIKLDKMGFYEKSDADLMRETAVALQSQAEQIDRLSVQLEACALVGVELSSRLESAEQQMQKLTADKIAALGLLNHLIDWIVHDCGAEVPFTDEQDAVLASLETQEGGK